MSIRALSLLPDIPTLRRISQSLALLDAILSRDWEYRYFSFNCDWAPQQAIASMRDGEGDGYLIWFNPEGVVLKGFAHESPMSPYRVSPPLIWLGVLDNLPLQFSSFLSEAAFSPEETTFCVWRTLRSGWQSGPVQFPEGQDPDGSLRLLKLLDGRPQSYQRWAEIYYQQSIDFSAVIHIYEHKPLTERVVFALNPNLSIQDLDSDLAEIGYG